VEDILKAHLLMLICSLKVS